MPPRLFSRFTFCSTVTDPTTGALILLEREPYPYAPFADNIQHTVTSGDTLWSLAQRYYGAIAAGANLWWVIADFQPDPIFDPTIQLAPGAVIVVPSVRTIQTEIFDEARRDL
jgi:hypothetical protein